ISQWKEQILTAVGDCGQVLIDVIPELELIIGPQPKVTELSGNAAQNRFNLLFGKFVRTFSTPEHPLVIFLDDLQWADAASLALLKRIVTEASTLEASETTEIDTDISLSVSLLVLGAYRDNETFAAHPLMLAIDELKGQGIEIDTLTLKPLNKTDINTLVADTLLCSPGIAQPLSELIYQKTQGNPFFTTQFLQGLHGESCITFNTALGHWECDLAKVRQLALTDDVVSFVVEQLKKLPPATQTTLKLAACIGNRFDLATLAVVCETSQDEVAAELWRSLQVGLVIPESENYKFFQSRKISNSAVQEESSTDSDAVETSPNLTVRYRFLHDRVQQAAYSLISEDQKQAIHLKIGQRLLQSSPEQDKSETFFAIVGQLNKGASLLESPNERHQLAQLNLKAGQKATEATAYAAAVEHFEQARQMLPADCWQNDYATALKLFVASLEAEYLSTNFAAIEPLAATILTNTQTVLDSISVHSVRIRAYIGQGDQHKALEIGLEVLALLGIALLEAPPNSASNIPALIDAPTTENPQILAAMDIMTGIITCAWAVNPRYFRRIAYTMVDLSLRYGNCPASSFGYAWYGTILCSYLGKIEVGYQFGRLAVDLLACFDTQVLQAKVLNIYATCIGCWQHHVRHCLPFHLDGLRSGLETGDLEFASYDAA
ncbi:MAG: AAA family ATPase, partial [Cyanobacteria bacterium J06649_4]